MGRHAKIGRAEADRIARAVVSGRRGAGARADALAAKLASAMRSRLEAVQAPGAARVQRSSRAVPRLGDGGRLLARVEKHLASWALVSDRRGDPDAR